MWFGMVVGNPSMPTMMDNSQEWKGNIAIQPWVDTCKPISPNSSGWWFQAFFMFHNIWDNPSH